MKSEILKIEIPKEVVEEAKGLGINFNRIKAVAKDFVLLEMVAQMSRLTEKDATNISRRIKINAWKKTEKVVIGENDFLILHTIKARKSTSTRL
jgi:hypothetical protein